LTINNCLYESENFVIQRYTTDATNNENIRESIIKNKKFYAIVRFFS